MELATAWHWVGLKIDRKMGHTPPIFSSLLGEGRARSRFLGFGPLFVPFVPEYF